MTVNLRFLMIDTLIGVLLLFLIFFVDNMLLISNGLVMSGDVDIFLNAYYLITLFTGIYVALNWMTVISGSIAIDMRLITIAAATAFLAVFVVPAEFSSFIPVTGSPYKEAMLLMPVASAAVRSGLV